MSGARDRKLVANNHTDIFLVKGYSESRWRFSSMAHWWIQALFRRLDVSPRSFVDD